MQFKMAITAFSSDLHFVKLLSHQVVHKGSEKFFKSPSDPTERFEHSTV